ncbi:MAG: OsmC family protein [Desulfobacterales bacterium]|nr:OsmC family protein [Desulfobacterales bacterium]
MGAALEAREIKSAENLTAEVEGDVEDVDGVLKISRIRLHYTFKIPPGGREKAERALAVYADACPAYQSVKGCIECSWTAELKEEA